MNTLIFPWPKVYDAHTAKILDLQAVCIIIYAWSNTFCHGHVVKISYTLFILEAVSLDNRWSRCEPQADLGAHCD